MDPIDCVANGESTSTLASNGTELNGLISKLRQQFLDSYAKCPEEYDSIDVQNIRTNDFQIKRFLTYNNLNEKLAFDQLIEAMKWRKSFGVKRDFSQLGVEIFQCGGLFIYGQDRNKRPVFYARVKTHMKVAALEEIVQDVIVATLERLDQLGGENGFTVVIDVSGAGLSNVDLKIAKFLITTMHKYFPESLKCLLVVNLPIIFRTFMPIIRLLLGSKYSHMLHVVNTEQLFQFIHPDYVPKYLGGNSTHDFTIPPEECTKKAEEFGEQYEMSPNTIRKALKKFEPHMIEAKGLVKL